MREIDSRRLGDGSGTTVTLFDRGDGTYVVEATNGADMSSAVLTNRADAATCYLHPFSSEEWLDYPGLRKRAAIRPLTDDEYAQNEMLEAQ